MKIPIISKWLRELDKESERKRIEFVVNNMSPLKKWAIKALPILEDIIENNPEKYGRIRIL